MRLVRAFLLLAFLFGVQTLAHATQITVAQTTISGWANSNTSPRLRIFLNKPVVTSDGKVLQSGSQTTGVFYQSITCSVAGGVLTIPQFTIDSLTDATVGSDALYSAYFYTSAGAQIAAYQGFTKFTVVNDPATTSWAAILTFNAAHVPFIDTLTYSRTEIMGLLGSITGVPQTRSIVTTSPLTIDGTTSADLSANRTLAIANAAADGATKGAATFTAADFNASSGLISIDYTNGQAASGAAKGFLTAADWTTFNAKQAALGYTAENVANKNATGGYAGLSSGKLALAQGQEVWAITDLSDIASVRGNSTQVQLTTGAVATNDCAKFDASGNLVSSGGPCGSGAGTGTVTSVAATVPAFLSLVGSPITTSGTLAITLSGTALPVASGGTGSTTQNFVDLTTGQSVAGAKTFTAAGVFSSSLDAIVKNSTAANLPAAGSSGRLYYQTDGARGLIVDQGAIWYFPDRGEINLQEFGARVDGRVVGDASMSSGVATLTSAAAAFTSADVGKLVAVSGAGAAGATLQTTIASITDSSHAVLTAAASTTISPTNAYIATDDSTAFSNALAAANAKGTTIRVPAGRMALTGAGFGVGDGTTTAISTINGIRIVGAGSGLSQMGFRSAPTEIWWFGDAGATILTFNGPMGGVAVEGMLFDAKVGANAAATAIQWNHVHHSRLHDLVVLNHSGFAIAVSTRPTGISGVGVGSDDNVISSIWSAAPSSTTGGGLQLGAAATTSYGTSRNQIRDSWFYAGSGASAKAVEVRYGDANNFWGVTTNRVSGSGVGITMTAATDNSAYPSAIGFYNVAAQGNTAVGGTWAPLDKIQFWPYSVADSETVPSDTGFSGVTTRNLFFGAFTFRDNLALQGNLSLTGSAKRVTGDFSAATDANRLLFQGSVVDGQTTVGAIPNGTSVFAGFRAYAASDPANTSFVELYANGTFNGAVNVGHTGSGTTPPFSVFVDRTTQIFQVSTAGHVTVGTGTVGDHEMLNAQGGAALNIGANDQYLNLLTLTELTTVAAAATTDTTIQIPANAVVLGVSARVTTVIPTAATFTVTGTTSGTVFNTAAISSAANSTDPGTKAGAFYNATAQTIRLTPNLTPGANSGRVRVTIHYYLISPPSS